MIDILAYVACLSVCACCTSCALVLPMIGERGLLFRTAKKLAVDAGNAALLALCADVEAILIGEENALARFVLATCLASLSTTIEHWWTLVPTQVVLQPSPSLHLRERYLPLCRTLWTMRFALTRSAPLQSCNGWANALACFVLSFLSRDAPSRAFYFACSCVVSSVSQQAVLRAAIAQDPSLAVVDLKSAIDADPVRARVYFWGGWGLFVRQCFSCWPACCLMSRCSA